MVLAALSRNAWAIVIVTLVLIVLSRVLAVYDARDPGFDQAMLLANFPLPSLSAYFAPLPFFEQTATLGSVLELDVLTRIFGNSGIERVTAARAVAALAAIAGYLVLWRFYRRIFPPALIALMLALIASTNETLAFTTNPKHYVFEFAVAVLTMWTGLAYVEKPGRVRGAIFLVSIFIACLFAFTAPLILASIGGGMLFALLAEHPVRTWTSGPVVGAVLRLAIIGLAAVAICFVFYIFYTKVVTVLDLTAYADRDANTYLDLADPLSEQTTGAVGSILNVFYLMVSPIYLDDILFRVGLISYLPIVHIVFAAIAVIGVLPLLRQSPMTGGGLICGFAAIFVLNIAEALPIASTRHFMFFAPFAVPAFAYGVYTLIGWALSLIGQRAWTMPAVGILAIGIAGSAVLKASDLETTEVSDSLALVDRFEAPLWVYYGAQPSLRALRPERVEEGAPRTLGLLSHESTEQAWLVQARDDRLFLTDESYFEAASRDLAGTDPVWLLFTHTWPERRTEKKLDAFLDHARADGRICKSVRQPGGLVALCALPGEFPQDVAFDDG